MGYLVAALPPVCRTGRLFALLRAAAIGADRPVGVHWLQKIHAACKLANDASVIANAWAKTARSKVEHASRATKLLNTTAPDASVSTSNGY